tara:strand:+ start:252 stop:512 length:261 start_codon:yes stop_codon:yes gene_type:complete
MNKEDFKILMYALYGNKQLIIPDGQTLQEWIDNAFVEKQEKAINYTHCCKSDSELLPNITLEQAIEKAKPNMDKIKDVDKHIDNIR